MKKICLMVAILVTTLLQTGFAQHEHANNQTQTPALLPLYYNIKDALVGGNATLAVSTRPTPSSPYPFDVFTLFDEKSRRKALGSAAMERKRLNTKSLL